MVRFAIAHLHEDFLASTAQALLFSEQVTTAGEPVGYRFGWKLESDANQHRYVRHSGGAIGGTSQLIIQPESGVAVAVIVNLSGADLSVADELVQLFVAAALLNH